MSHRHPFAFLFFFNDTAPTEIYTLSLHDALPIFLRCTLLLTAERWSLPGCGDENWDSATLALRDRKSTRLNSSHVRISYAVFCLKKKNSPAATQSPLVIPKEPLASLARISQQQPH